MTEEQLRKARAQAREFPETMEIIARIRTALASKLFETPVSARDLREEIYLRVQTLDAMKGEMGKLLAEEASERAISDYVEKLATTEN